MFKVGEYISYRTEGVCIIKDIRKECFGALGKSEEYYVLAPLKDMNSMLYVPVENKLLVDKMQRLLSADEIYNMVSELSHRRLEWIAESRVRGNAFKEILNVGDRSLIIVLINTILEHKKELEAQGKRLTNGDEAILKRAKKLLLDEFSATTDIKTEEELMSLLQGEHKPSALVGLLQN